MESSLALRKIIYPSWEIIERVEEIGSSTHYSANQAISPSDISCDGGLYRLYTQIPNKDLSMDWVNTENQVLVSG